MTQILTIGLALTPLSLIIVLGFYKTLAKYSSKLSKTTTICTEVIGVLTKQKLTVKSLIFDKYEGEVEEDSETVEVIERTSKDELNIEKLHLKNHPSIALMATITALCHYQKVKRSELIISNFFKKCNLPSIKLQHKYDIVTKIPSSDEKKMSTVVAAKKVTREIYSFSKGNPKAIIDNCERILINGKHLELTSKTKRKLKKQVSNLYKKGQRIIAFAYKPLPKKRLASYSESFTENDMVFIGMVGFSDTIEENLIPIIGKAQKEGLKFYILSKSKERTATAIAKELGIINPSYFEALTSQDLEYLSDQKITKKLKNKEKDLIFCKLTQEDKNRIIKLLQDSGETIAIAEKDQKLKLEKIISTIRKQRFDNVNSQKIFFHALACKISQVVLLLICLLVRAPLALSIAGIIIIDLFVNGLTEFTIYRQQKKTANLENSQLLINSLTITCIIGIIYFWNMIRLGWYPGEIINPQSPAVLKATTITLILFALIQIINAFYLSTPKTSILEIKPKNKIHLILSSIVSILIIYSVLHFEFFRNLINLSSLNMLDLQIIIFGLTSFLIIEESHRLISRNAKST